MELAAVTCAFMAAVVGLWPSAARARLGSLRLAESPRDNGVRGSRGESGALLAQPHTRIVVSVGVVVVTAFLVGGIAGVIVGVVVGVGFWFGVSKLEPASQRRERERIEAMLPLATTLMSSALSVGCPPITAAEIVSRAVSGPLGQMLQAAATASRIGVDPEDVWLPFMKQRSTQPLGRALAAATGRGVSPSLLLERAAKDARDTAHWAGVTRARSVGARAAVPLGLCFLPAFVALGVVPIVVTSGAFLSL